jgi:hypothetical protein
MGDQEFQSEVFSRLSKLEQQNARILAIQSERCTVRGEELKDMDGRVSRLEAAEHKRQGRDAVMVAGTGLISGLLARFFPFGGS